MRRFRPFRALSVVGLALLYLLAAGCFIDSGDRKPRSTLFVGVDASGSFKHSGYYDNSLKFLAYYIYTHLNELGGTTKPKAMFVASVGGKATDEPKTFHPIHDFDFSHVQPSARDQSLTTSAT